MWCEQVVDSVPIEVEIAIRAAAETAGLPVSVWLARAAERAAAGQAAIADGLAVVAEFETKSPSADITSSTFPGFMIASQVNGGDIDIHTVPRTAVTTTVASTPCMPLTETLRGMPLVFEPGRLGW